MLRRVLVRDLAAPFALIPNANRMPIYMDRHYLEGATHQTLVLRMQRIW